MHVTYRNVVFDDVNGPATPSDLTGLEADLGAALPQEVSEFLTAVGGGHCEFSLEVTFRTGKTQTVTLPQWHGFTGPATFAQALQVTRARLQIPPGVLPIANSNWEHFLFLDLSGHATGQAVLFVMGRPAWTGLNTESEFVPVAESLNAVLDRMILDDDTAQALMEELGDNDEADRRIERILDLGRPGWRTA